MSARGGRQCIVRRAFRGSEMADHGYMMTKYKIDDFVSHQIEKWCNFIKNGLISPFFNSYCHYWVSARGGGHKLVKVLLGVEKW